MKKVTKTGHLSDQMGDVINQNGQIFRSIYQPTDIWVLSIGTVGVYESININSHRVHPNQQRMARHPVLQNVGVVQNSGTCRTHFAAQISRYWYSTTWCKSSSRSHAVHPKRAPPGCLTSGSTSCGHRKSSKVPTENPPKPPKIVQICQNVTWSESTLSIFPTRKIYHIYIQLHTYISCSPYGRYLQSIGSFSSWPLVQESPASGGRGAMTSASVLSSRALGVGRAWRRVGLPKQLGGSITGDTPS